MQKRKTGGNLSIQKEPRAQNKLKRGLGIISAPQNLQRITPPELGFEITSALPEKMYEGMIITYKVSPLLSIKTTWVTKLPYKGTLFLY